MEVSNGSIKRSKSRKHLRKGAFIGEIFDKFLVREAEIVTWNRFSIDGKDPSGIFFGRRARGEPDRRIFFLEELKADLLPLIRGKRLPESFRIVFLMPPSAKRPVCFRGEFRGSVRIR